MWLKATSAGPSRGMFSMPSIVQWNHVEASWDCPCHGSRFDPYGTVLMGPAITDLKKLDEQPSE